jgi:superfamily II RNA helicase
LVRAIRRLHELLLQLKTACDVIGDGNLSERFEEAAGKLKRDVVFAASLYL